MYRTKTNYTEEAFLLSTFSEFVKCWKSSKKSRLFIESVNGMAFMNFSVFLGNPSEAHSPHYTPHHQRRHPSSKENKRKKSAKKIQRDNERAAKFQENKRKELAAASAASGNPSSFPSSKFQGDEPAATSAASGNPTPSTSSKVQDKTRDEHAAASAASGDPPQTSSLAESSVGDASVNFSFASPVAEDKTDDSMEGVSDPQLSPKNLKCQPEDPSSAALCQNEVIISKPGEELSSSNSELNSCETSQFHQGLNKDEKATIMNMPTEYIKKVLCNYHKNSEESKILYGGLTFDKVVPTLREELRRRGIPDELHQKK